MQELSSARRTARVVGMLILGGYLTYGVGTPIATGIAAAPDSLSTVSGSTLFTASAMWMLLNSALVIGIGALMLPILRPHNTNIALGYFATRVFEGIILAVGVISLLSLVIISRNYVASGAADASSFETLGALAVNGNFLAYNVAQAGLGLGSLFFCYLMFRTNLVPRFLAIWGLVGYAILAAGCVLELLGFAGTGLVATIPGGLFEIFFGIWLIAKGFNPSAITIGAAKTAGVVTP